MIPSRFVARLSLVTILSIFAACGGLSSQQKTAANEAMSSLRKLESSSQVGASYMHYGPLLIDARAKVNEVSAKLPDGELKNEIKSAMDAYESAGSMWKRTLDWGNIALQKSAGEYMTKEEKIKYSLPASGDLSRSQVMDAMWAAGSKHVAQASILLDK